MLHLFPVTGIRPLQPRPGPNLSRSCVTSTLLHNYPTKWKLLCLAGPDNGVGGGTASALCQWSTERRKDWGHGF
ncbi:hypothetical protein OYC64_006147 [Pagothenia borchgrevinki]|uniref:Uncharacterized protein n=1 Tax=Pagothenia borchgrevinki TaxID=8213 RepID=A0ABD2GIY7_PAGBO